MKLENGVGSSYIIQRMNFIGALGTLPTIINAELIILYSGNWTSSSFKIYSPYVRNIA